MLSSTEGLCGFVDDFKFWQDNTYHHTAGKPLWIDLSDTSVHHVIFDDNIRVTDDDSIVDVRVLDTTASSNGTPGRSILFVFVNPSIQMVGTRRRGCQVELISSSPDAIPCCNLSQIHIHFGVLQLKPKTQMRRPHFTAQPDTDSAVSLQCGGAWRVATRWRSSRTRASCRPTCCRAPTTRTTLSASCACARPTTTASCETGLSDGDVRAHASTWRFVRCPRLSSCQMLFAFQKGPS